MVLTPQLAKRLVSTSFDVEDKCGSCEANAASSESASVSANVRGQGVFFGDGVTVPGLMSTIRELTCTNREV